MKKILVRGIVFFVGVGVLLLAIFVFFTLPRRDAALESAYLRDWRGATVERRIAAARVLTASEKNLELLVACVDKMATLPDSADMQVRDAMELCFVGIQLKNNTYQEQP